uniref:Neuromedin U C-terminal domain-containing protein n=1 Tax=Amphiprion percula TaxID=161767 RepID=A0A3P8T8Z1_AMPPE
VSQREMSSVRSHSGASSSLQSLSSSSMSPLSAASICTLTALLLLTVPLCHSKSRNSTCFCIDAVCSSYLSADLKLWASDILGELCVLMLVQKSKVLLIKFQNTPRLHPLLRLISQLHTRRERELTMHGPGGIQSRGYFLYRPRNGRRSLEYE